MSTTKSSSAKQVRVNRPERTQIEMQLMALEQMLPEDHRARIVWRFVESLDLDPLYARIQVSVDSVGRNATAPEILLALWLLATLDGISSARELDRRCETDIPYMWIRGHVGVNYHTLSDFRVQNGDFLDKLLTDTVTSLIHQGLVPLEAIGQDGMRVRASAGSSSFRRKKTLEVLHKKAAEHVKRLREESEDEAKQQQGDARRKAAQQRAAREREERVRKALDNMDELQEIREKRKKGEGEKARCSTTDPDARNMKMGDGGFRPAFNVQFATDGDARVIVAVDVTNSGSDRGQMAPLYEDVCSRYSTTPKHYIVDSAFATKDDIKTLEQAQTQVVSSVPRADQLRRQGKDPHARQPGDSDEFAAFRERMGTEPCQDLYRQRPSIAEFPNADCRNRGLHQFRVRGLAKVKAVALWHALAFNFMRMVNLEVIA